MDECVMHATLIHTRLCLVNVTQCVDIKHDSQQ